MTLTLFGFSHLLHTAWRASASLHRVPAINWRLQNKQFDKSTLSDLSGAQYHYTQPLTVFAFTKSHACDIRLQLNNLRNLKTHHTLLSQLSIKLFKCQMEEHKFSVLCHYLLSSSWVAQCHSCFRPLLEKHGCKHFSVSFNKMITSYNGTIYKLKYSGIKAEMVSNWCIYLKSVIKIALCNAIIIVQIEYNPPPSASGYRFLVPSVDALQHGTIQKTKPFPEKLLLHLLAWCHAWLQFAHTVQKVATHNGHLRA